MDPSLTEKFITTKDAGEFSGYSSDYLSRLVRSKKIIGKRIGRNWIIDKESLTHFVNEQGNYKSDRARELASTRAKEYRAHRSLLHRATKSLTAQTSVPERFSIANSSFSSHASAFAVALMVIVSGVFAAQTEMIPHLAHDVASLAREAASGFDAAFGGVPGDIASRIDAANSAMRSVSPRLRGASAIDFSNSAAASFATFSEVDSSPLRMAIDTVTSDTRAIAFTPTPSAEESVRTVPEIEIQTNTLTQRDLGERGLDAISFLVSPSRVTSALKDTCVGIGTDAYDGITASFVAYDLLIRHSGAGALALAATTRDALATTPRLISNMNLALGTSIIAASHAAIQADTATAYWAAAAAPASARATVASIGSAGDALARATADAAQEAPVFIARTLRSLSDAGPALARAVFNAEYAMATRFVAVTDSITSGYARALHRLGEAGYESALGVRHAIKLAATLPDALHDAYLGALGKSALALDVLGSAERTLDAVKHAPLLAAALSGLSLGEQTALATYETIRGVFDSANQVLVAFFTTTPPLVLPNGVPKARVITIATSTKPATPYNSLPTTSLSYPTYTTVVQGISADVLNRSLASLRTEMFDTIAAQIRPVAAQTVTNASTIQQVNMIQDLSNLIVRNGDFRGGTFSSGSLTNGISVAATTGNFDTLTSGTTTLANLSVTNTSTSTFAGPLTVAGVFTANNNIFTITGTTTASNQFTAARAPTLAHTFSSWIPGVANSNVNDATFLVNPATAPADSNLFGISVGGAVKFLVDAEGDTFVNSLTSVGATTLSTTTASSFTVENSFTVGDSINDSFTIYPGIINYFNTSTSTIPNNLVNAWSLATSSTSTPIFSIDTAHNGRIGIGTTTPASVFDIYGTDAIHLPVGTTAQRPSMALTGQARYNTTTHQFEGYGDNAVWQGLGGVINAAQTSYITAGADDFLRFVTSSAERMTIASGGSIGVGTTSPLARLDVAGANNGTAPLLQLSSVAGFATTTQFSVSNSGQVTLGSDGSLAAPAIVWANDSGTGFYKSAANILDFAAGGSQMLRISPGGFFALGNFQLSGDKVLGWGAGVAGSGASDAAISRGAAAKLYVGNGTAGDYTGTLIANSIGIGTTSPWGELSVNPDGITGPSFVVGSSTATNFIVTNSGNVGIGTTSPAFKLDVNGIVNATALYVNGTPYIGSQWTTSGSNIYYTTGTVGIGTTSPFASLSIATTTGKNLVLSDSGAGANLKHWLFSSLGGSLYVGTTTDAYATSSPPAFTITNSGNVGIGTSSPFTTLSVVGTTRLKATTNASTTFMIENASATTTFQVSTLDTSDNIFSIASSTGDSYLEITSSGNVGIGVVSPTEKLEVNGAVHLYSATPVSSSMALYNNAGTLTWNGVALATGGSSISGTTNYIPVFTGAATLGNSVLYQSGTSVGIGTTSPSQALAVQGNGYFSGTGFFGGAITSTSTLSIQSTTATSTFSTGGLTIGTNQFVVQQTSGRIGIGTTTPASILDIYGTDAIHLPVGTTAQRPSMALTGQVRYNVTTHQFEGYSDSAVWQGLGGVVNTAQTSYITAGTDDFLRFFTSSVERMTISSAGLVGIGTTTPFAALHVATTTGKNLVLSDSGAGANLKHWLFSSLGGSLYVGTTTDSYATSSPSALTILNNGNLGIGTTSPSATLAVVGTARFKSTTDSANALVVENSAGANSFQVSTVADNGNLLSIASSTGVSYFEITSDGNIGIGGVTAPLSLLDINGGVAIGSYAGVTAAPTNGLIVSGSVGIGTSTPGTLLSIGGDATGINFVDGTSATSTISGNLRVKGTLRAAVSYVGDLIFSNGFRFIEGDLNAPVQTLQLQNQFGSTTLTVADNGNIGIGTTTPNHMLTVAGDIAAISFVNTSTREAKTDISYVSASSAETILNQLTDLKVATYHYKIENQNDPLRLGLIAEETQSVAPEVLSLDGKGVDLYKLATFTLAGVQALSAKVDAHETHLTSLESRITALESGAISSASGSPLSLSTTSLASALNGLGVLIQKGIAQFNTLVFRQLVASKDADGTSSAGSVSIPVGSALAQVTNSLVLPSTKIFVTFNSSVAGSWWVSDKTAGSFRVVLSAPQTTDVSFDYFLVQTEGQMATSTPNGIGGVTQSSGPDTTPPVITMLGANPMRLSIGSTFAEPGITVADAVDGTDPYITFVNGIQQIASSATIDTSAQITYIITYSATDAAGNSATATRSVIIGSTPPPADTTAPVVTLTGAAALQLTVGDTFTDLGATALDDVDGDITAKIVETGTATTTAAGSYSLTYTATDAAGNTGSASRLVTVVSSTPAI